MRAAVMNDSGFQPFSVSASRLAVASILLFAWAKFRRMNLWVSAHDLMVLAVSGILIWVCGNGFVMWTEQWVDAGYATLVFSSLPIWTTLMECWLDRQRPSRGMVLAFLAAFAGMALLGGRELFEGQKHVLVPTVVILFSTFLWAISTHLQKRRPVSCSPFIASAYQQLFGSLGGLMMALVMRESWPHPTQTAWIAWWYLVIFGSIIAYSSYIIVVKTFPPAVSMTFAYVCPVVTVILGYLVLGEEVTANKLVGMVIILSAVYSIFREQKKLKEKTS